MGSPTAGPAAVRMCTPTDWRMCRLSARSLDFWTSELPGQLKQRDFDRAIQSIQDGLRLAEFVRSGETLIQQARRDRLSRQSCGKTSRKRSQLPVVRIFTGHWPVFPAAITECGIPSSLKSAASHRFLPMLSEAETDIWTEDEAAAHWQSMLTELKSISGLSGWEMRAPGITPDHCGNHADRSGKIPDCLPPVSHKNDWL